jgi:hypothetical protein
VTRAPSAPNRLVACDQVDTPCDDGGGGGGGGTTQPPSNGILYIKYFGDSQLSSDYYELRQVVRQADGTGIGYNPQRYNGYIGFINPPTGYQVIDRFPCGGYIELSIYKKGWFNTWDFVTLMDIPESMNGQPITWNGGPTGISGSLLYSWAACT